MEARRHERVGLIPQFPVPVDDPGHHQHSRALADVEVLVGLRHDRLTVDRRGGRIEPHHWGMRDAPDVVFVVSGYLSAYNAKAFGVHDYIAQLMFNSPPGLSDAMDLAKMLAILEMIQPLSSPDFRIWKQTRTGLLSYPLDPAAARAHLAASIYVQMALKPDIIHIVSYTEADHAATADDVIESTRMAQRVINNALKGQPDMLADQTIQKRKNELISDASLVLDAIRALALPSVPDPLTDPHTLARAVITGILDAPQLKNNPFARGQISTRYLDGRCVAVFPDGTPMPESIRLANLRKESIS